MQCALIFVSNIGGSQVGVIGPQRTLHPRTLQWFFEGLYVEPLRVWTALFPREQILVLTTEQLLQDARGQALQRLFDHIGAGDVSGAGGLTSLCTCLQLDCLLRLFQLQRRLLRPVRQPLSGAT